MWFRTLPRVMCYETVSLSFCSLHVLCCSQLQYWLVSSARVVVNFSRLINVPPNRKKMLVETGPKILLKIGTMRILAGGQLF